MQLLRDTSESSSPDLCAREVLDAVPPVIWFIRREMRAFRRDLSLAQFRTLSLVQRQPAASLSVVAEHLGASLPTASRMVHGLVERGLLARQGCHEDRRQLALAITPKGEALIKTAYEETQGQLKKELDSLSPAQHQTIAEAMVSLKRIFGALGLDGNGHRSNAADRIKRV
jgi:DNA-binding MarR family transcriptional regulator